MKKMSLVLALLFLCTFVWYSQAGEVRTWTAGNFSVDGEFVELIENGTIVRIRKSNGKFMRVPLAKLSEEDQKYVKEETGNPFEEETVRAAGDRMVLTADGIEYVFHWCPPGEFMMGSENGDEDETPVHKVKLTKGFWILETEVTQEMWQSVMGENPSEFEGDKNPVESVSWGDCQEFCKKLSQKFDQLVQLPTEAQWEYACRAGTTTEYCWGDNENLLCKYGNYCDKSNTDDLKWQDKNHNDGNDKTAPVGSYKPNPWGLYDVYGNVWEWCSDYYSKDYYSESPTSDPGNTTESEERVARGGSWSDYTGVCRSAIRIGLKPGVSSHIGLRVIVVPDQE